MKEMERLEKVVDEKGKAKELNEQLAKKLQQAMLHQEFVNL